MIYNTVSIENVIGRVIRNTKITDTSAIQDIYEWIPEAMELLQTKYELEPKCKPLNIRFHQALLPKGLVYIEAVVYGGQRLRYSEQLRAKPDNPSGAQTVFQSVPELKVNPATGNSMIGWTSEQLKNIPESGAEYYYLKPNYLCTSMRDCKEVLLYYKSVPMDENGFPMIPDNGAYKEALYWYVRGKLIGSGQLVDPRNTEDKCNQLFEMHGGRAINEITYPSVDKMEMIRANQLNFAIPENYWNNFNAV